MVLGTRDCADLRAVRRHVWSRWRFTDLVPDGRDLQRPVGDGLVSGRAGRRRRPTSMDYAVDARASCTLLPQDADGKTWAVLYCCWPHHDAWLYPAAGRVPARHVLKECRRWHSSGPIIGGWLYILFCLCADVRCHRCGAGHARDRRRPDERRSRKKSCPRWSWSTCRCHYRLPSRRCLAILPASAARLLKVQTLSGRTSAPA